jgi:hypothetical protein
MRAVALVVAAWLVVSLCGCGRVEPQARRTPAKRPSWCCEDTPALVGECVMRDADAVADEPLEYRSVTGGRLRAPFRD